LTYSKLRASKEGKDIL